MFYILDGTLYYFYSDNNDFIFRISYFDFDFDFDFKNSNIKKIPLHPQKFLTICDLKINHEYTNIL